jgi:hypothetical protein
MRAERTKTEDPNSRVETKEFAKNTVAPSQKLNKTLFLPTNCKPKRRKVYENCRNKLKDLKGNVVNKKVHHIFTKVFMTVFSKVCPIFSLKTIFFR